MPPLPKPPPPRGNRVSIRHNTSALKRARINKRLQTRAKRNSNNAFGIRHPSLSGNSFYIRADNHPARGTRRSIEPRPSSKNRLIQVPLQEIPKYPKMGNNYHLSPRFLNNSNNPLHKV